ncbi:MAG: hypothetical protein WAN58_12185 [Anaerolineales bacterium]
MNAHNGSKGTIPSYHEMDTGMQHYKEVWRRAQRYDGAVKDVEKNKALFRSHEAPKQPTLKERRLWRLDAALARDRRRMVEGSSKDGQLYLPAEFDG